MGFMELSSISWAEIRVPIDLIHVFQGMNLWSCPKEVKPLVLYHGERAIAQNPMHGNRSSFQDDLGYTELFHIPAVTLVSF